MTHYNTLNVKLSNSQFNKLKSGIKEGTAVTLKLSSNVIDDSHDKNSFPHKLLLTDTKVSKLRKAFTNNFSANIKLSKTQLDKIGKSGGFLVRLLGPLLQIGFPLMKNVLKILSKRVLIQLHLTAVANDAAIYKKTFGLGTATLIISNEVMNGVMGTFKSLEQSALLIKGVSEAIKDEPKEKKEKFSECY